MVELYVSTSFSHEELLLPHELLLSHEVLLLPHELSFHELSFHELLFHELLLPHEVLLESHEVVAG